MLTFIKFLSERFTDDLDQFFLVDKELADCYGALKIVRCLAAQCDTQLQPEVPLLPNVTKAAWG
jgi:hypothetical protein